MPALTIEQRLTALEVKVEKLQCDQPPQPEPWWKKHSGAFKDSEIYEEVVRLGAEYRMSQPTAADEPDLYY